MTVIPADTVRTLLQIRLVRRDLRQWRLNTPRLTEALRALSRSDAEQIAEAIAAAYEPRTADLLLGQLATTVPGSLTELGPRLVAQHRLFPGWLYLDATRSTAQNLLEALLDPAYREERKLLLQCLAWTGSEIAQAQFHAWRENTPSWASELYASPAEEALAAGWELTRDGDRRHLYRQSAYELGPNSRSDSIRGTSAGAMVGLTEERCGWCDRPLVTLFDIDLSDPHSAFVAPHGTRLRIAYCAECSSYTPTFTDVDLHGGVRWSESNGEKPAIVDWLSDNGEMPELLPRYLVLGSPRGTPFEAVGRFSLDESGISQLGGHPEWIQKVAYPTCPRCNQHMECIGQVAWDDIDEDAASISYAFLCLECGKAATVYQRT